MSGALLFALVVIAMALASILVVFEKPRRALQYFKSIEGRKVAFGIAVFCGTALAIALLSFSARADWFEYAEVYVGLDNTNDLSPQCDATGPNSRLTSNGGLRANVFVSEDDRFHFNTKYTHHSCAFSPDRESYDAIGLEASYRFWMR